jgi:hypothetical protein
MNKLRKLGKVTFVDTGIGASKGAFIEDLSDKLNITVETKSLSPTSKVYVPMELLQNLKLKQGQLVEFEEENNVATEIKSLA